MKDKVYIIIVFLLILWAGLHVMNKYLSVNFMSIVRDKFESQGKEFNNEVLLQENRISEIYKRADLNLEDGIAYADSILKYGELKDRWDTSRYHAIIGELYFENNIIDSALKRCKTIEELTLDTPRNKLNKAGCYIKLGDYEKAMSLLIEASEMNYDFKWYVGNLYEIIKDKNSAIDEYNFLFRKDTIIYDYCEIRINELKDGASLMEELLFKDRRKRMYILMDTLDKNDPSRAVAKWRLENIN